MASRSSARHGIKKRERILSDHELALIWRKADGLFGNFTKLALLTGQRREKLATMRWSDIVDGVWNVPNGTREKGVGGELVLPAIALEILDDQRRVNDEGVELVGPLHIDEANPYVFAGRGLTHFSGYSKRKRVLDAKLKIKPAWVLHDLRRTARSLLAAAGVPDLHAERVLGHKQQGVDGIYNRHDYFEEKAEALAHLAARIRDIVDTPPDNVRKLRKSA
jgi:integrase